MPDLIAQGIEAQQRWRRTLPEGETIVFGRVLLVQASTRSNVLQADATLNATPPA